MCEPEVTSDKEGRVVSHLLEDENSIPRLRLILNHASNRDLLYKIVGKLSLILYERVSGDGLSNIRFTLDSTTDGRPKNSNYLIFLLAEAILNMQQNDLVKISHDKLFSMHLILHLYISFRTEEGKKVVYDQIEKISSIIRPKANFPRDEVSLDIDYEKTKLAMDRAEAEMRERARNRGISYDKIAKKDFIQPDVNIRERRGQIQVDSFAKRLVDFYMGALASEEKNTLMQVLLTNKALIQPLNVIFMDSRNKPLLHKIVARLTNVLYEDIRKDIVSNAQSLTLSLGAAIMNIEPEELGEFSIEEIRSMRRMLVLYKKGYSSQIDKKAVASKLEVFLNFINSLAHSAKVVGDSFPMESLTSPEPVPTSPASAEEPASSRLLEFLSYTILPYALPIAALKPVHVFFNSPKDIHVYVKDILEALLLATGSIDPDLSTNEWWSVTTAYRVAEQKVLSVLALQDQEELLTNILSTPEIAVTVDATQRDLKIINIQAKHWRVNWNAYGEYLKLQKINFSNFAKTIKMPDSFIAEIRALLRKYFVDLINYYGQDIDLQVTLNPGIVFSFHIPNYPALVQDLRDIISENGGNISNLPYQVDKKELAFSFPLSNLVRKEELDFEDSFSDKIRKTNLKILAQIETRRANFLNANKIVGSLQALHVEQHNITYRAEKSTFGWVLESNRSYLFGNEAIEADSFASILQYVLRKLYALESTIEVEDNNSIVSHTYFVGSAGDKKVEANALIQDIINSFTRLRQRYKPAVCKLLYEDGRIKIQVSLGESQNIFEGVSRQEFFNFMKEELKEKNVLAKNIKKSGGGTVIFSISPPQPALSEFKGSFENFCIEKKEAIRLTEEAAVKAKEKMVYEEKLKPVLQELNDFLADITDSPFHNLKWQIGSGVIELTLREKSYYAENSLSTESPGIEITRNAFSLLILDYLGQARGVAKEHIITKPNTLLIKNPIQLLSYRPFLYALPFERL